MATNQVMAASKPTSTVVPADIPSSTDAKDSGGTKTATASVTGTGPDSTGKVVTDVASAINKDGTLIKELSGLPYSQAQRASKGAADCSSLTERTYKMAGAPLDKSYGGGWATTNSLYDGAKKSGQLFGADQKDKLAPGDMLFFRNEKVATQTGKPGYPKPAGYPTHVGMYAGTDSSTGTEMMFHTGGGKTSGGGKDSGLVALGKNWKNFIGFARGPHGIKDSEVVAKGLMGAGASPVAKAEATKSPADFGIPIQGGSNYSPGAGGDKTNSAEAPSTAVAKASQTPSSPAPTAVSTATPSTANKVDSVSKDVNTAAAAKKAADTPSSTATKDASESAGKDKLSSGIGELVSLTKETNAILSGQTDVLHDISSKDPVVASTTGGVDKETTRIVENAQNAQKAQSLLSNSGGSKGFAAAQEIARNMA
jgi:cell wall-associated NlpC family hydrolase